MQPVLHVRAFEDNYIWVIRGNSRTYAALVDPGDAAPVLAALPRLGITPVAILCTHHHADHVGGIPELLEHFPGLPVYGPAHENIDTLTQHLHDNDEVRLPELGLNFRVLEVPGHTRGHIAYFGHGWLFCGDTLFSAGCGRLFEGTAAQMHTSLSRLAGLPGDTRVYCAHEYTQANLRFAQTVEPENADIAAYRREARSTAGTRRTDDTLCPGARNAHQSIPAQRRTGGACDGRETCRYFASRQCVRVCCRAAVEG